MPSRANLDDFQTSFREIMHRVKSGDTVAEQRLWNQFYEKLLRYVQGKVRGRGVPIGLLDEEAITVSALESVYKCAKNGTFQDVEDLSELSRLFFAMTNRKFVDHWRRATTQRAKPRLPIVELGNNDVALSQADLAEYSIAFGEQLSQLMVLLPDDLHRRIAVLKLGEYTLDEISEEIDYSVPTVTRKWQRIRRMWADELERQ
jgi:DNA-directed RNA polymerase specialized sigma24 family protein